MLRGIASRIMISAISLQLAACSTAPLTNKDPYEKLNREIYGFNQTVDRALIRPVAYAYMTYLPDPIQNSVSNFFDNIHEIPTVANDLLQFKIADAMHDTSRFLINSTLGIFGLFDPATSLGLMRNDQDFGRTLYTWGYKDSIFIMLPFLGPSTVRDGLGKGVDFWAFSIWPYIESDWTYALLALSIIDERAKFLRHEKVLDVISIDEYLMIRDAYLQNREFRLTGKKDGIEEEPSEVSKSGVITENGIDDSFFEETESEPEKAGEKANTPAGESKALGEDDIEIYEEPNKTQNEMSKPSEADKPKDDSNKVDVPIIQDELNKGSSDIKQDKTSKEIMNKDGTNQKSADEEENISWKMLHLMLEVTQK